MLVKGYSPSVAWAKDKGAQRDLEMASRWMPTVSACYMNQLLNSERVHVMNSPGGHGKASELLTVEGNRYR